MTIAFWILVGGTLTVAAGLTEHRRWQWAAEIMERIEKP